MSRNHHRGEPQIGHPSDEGLLPLAARAEAPAFLRVRSRGSFLGRAQAASARRASTSRVSCSLRSRASASSRSSLRASGSALWALRAGHVGARARGRLDSHEAGELPQRRVHRVAARLDLVEGAQRAPARGPGRRGPARQLAAGRPERRVVVVEVGAQPLEGRSRRLRAAREAVGLEQLVALGRDPAVAALVAVDVGGPPSRHRLDDRRAAAEHEVGVVRRRSIRASREHALDDPAPVVGDAVECAGRAPWRGRSRQRAARGEKRSGPRAAQADDLAARRRRPERARRPGREARRPQRSRRAAAAAARGPSRSP